MTLLAAVDQAIRKTGLKPHGWAQTIAKLPKSTFRDLRRTGTCSGRTLAKLQRAGVRVADRGVIDSLDAA